jgi:hypothetical protein
MLQSQRFVHLLLCFFLPESDIFCSSLAQAAGNKRTPAPAEPRNDWEDPKVITKMFFDGRKY